MPEYRYFQYIEVEPRRVVPHHWRPDPGQRVICYQKSRAEIFRTRADSILAADKLFETATGIVPSKKVEVGCEVHP